MQYLMPGAAIFWHIKAVNNNPYLANNMCTKLNCRTKIYS